MQVHDQLFKRLLRAFFPDFLEGFVPDLHRELDPESIQFFDKELVRAFGTRHQVKLVDLVARVKFRQHEGFVLVHVEHQAKREREIGQRLFLFASWLIASYGLPVYPILLASYDAPFASEPDRFQMEVLGYGVRDFRISRRAVEPDELARLRSAQEPGCDGPDGEDDDPASGTGQSEIANFAAAGNDAARSREDGFDCRFHGELP